MADIADDRQAIVDLMNGFADALDRQDWDRLASLLTPDFSFGSRKVEKGTTGDFFQTLEGPGRMVEFTRGVVGRLSATHHILGNHRVEIEAGAATARASAHMRAHHAGKGDKAHLYQESLGRYDFRVVRDGGGWRATRIEQNIFTTLGTNEVFT